MSKKLIIVESPGKIKKIQSFLGAEYRVLASYGHIREISKDKNGIEKDNDFKVNFKVSEDKKDVVKGLKKLVKESSIVYLASDADREGEAISWHLKDELAIPEEKIRRITFTEITEKAIKEAIANPILLDMNMVYSQRARAVLDRLVGFDLSPLLWKKIKPNLSAGRVQSVALKILVEKEKEINSFTTSSDFKTDSLFKFNDYQFKGVLNDRFKDSKIAKAFLEKCKTSIFEVESMEKTPGKRSSPPPFTTSTLQQAASSKLGFSLSRIMSAAQSLYEGGHITYMRTDSVILSEDSLNSIEKEINTKYGKEFSNRKSYKGKAKGAQEAHEAIRPVYAEKDTAGDSDDCRRLYSLIWKRTMASQMSDASIEKTVITTKISNSKEKFVTRGEVITFEGFLKLYTPDEKNDEDEGGLLPNLKKGDTLESLEIISAQSFKKPPTRYSEANIVKKLEELGIGRPSTYASIISTIQKREYVVMKDIESEEKKIEKLTLSSGSILEESKTEKYGGEKKKLVPTDTGILVSDYLSDNFEQIMDYNFTANVENNFDEIAKGNSNWIEVIRNFYTPFSEKVKNAGKDDGKINVRELGLDPETQKMIYAKIGKFGPMVQMGEKDEILKPKFAKLKDGQEFASITLEDAIELLKWPKVIGEYNEKEMSVAVGKFGPYIKYDGGFVSMGEAYDVETIIYEQAIEILKESLAAKSSKVIKEFKSKDIFVLNGKFGAYIKKGPKNYKIPEYKEASDLTLKDCEDIIKNSKSKIKKKK